MVASVAKVRRRYGKNIWRHKEGQWGDRLMSWRLKGRQSSEETLCVAKYGAKMLHRDVISSGDVK